MSNTFFFSFIVGSLLFLVEAGIQHKRYGDMLLSKRQEDAILHPGINERQGERQHRRFGDMLLSQRQEEAIKHHNINERYIQDLEGEKQHRRYGDMLLSRQQEEAILHPDINERKAIKFLFRRWTNNTIPYIYAVNATQNRKTVEEGFDFWRENTCLEIVEDVNGRYSTVSHIKIGNLDDGCYSHVGKITSEKPQELNLGYGCVSADTVAHEFGHSLGLFHEQGRTDRDQYVTLMKKNVDIKNHGEFNLQIHSNNYGTPYDYMSIMHYAAYDFSINGQIVIAPKDIWVEPLIGKVSTPSYIDYLIVNKMYKCQGNCSDIECSGNGFAIRKRGKCKCICKEDYLGEKCKSRKSAKLNICPNTEIRTSGGIIISPKYPKPFPSALNCMWLITAPEGKKIELEAEKFDIHPKGRSSKKCTLDYLRVRYGDLENGGTTELFCGRMLDKRTFNSNRAFLIFHSLTNGLYPGFKIKVNFV